MKSGEELRIKVDKLIEKIKETENELKNLRKLCKHSEYQIKDINFGASSSKLRKVCKFCEDVIGFPSNDDLKAGGYT